MIPLSKKLKECGCFGVSSDEYLNYAMANRREWELKGESIVRDQYMVHYRSDDENDDDDVDSGELNGDVEELV